jgi:hypothetical protein
VIFSAPTEGEGDVALTTSVRSSFARPRSGVDQRTDSRSYNAQEAAERGEPAPPHVEFTAQIVEATE